jgi:hypothetical protein
MAAALLLTLLPTVPVFAHHGWSTFDTRHAYYVTGTVTYVRWGNPHSEVKLRVEKVNLPANFAERELPSGGNERDGRETLASARAYDGRHAELELVLAGPSWMDRWGLTRPLQVGEKIEAVGFLNAGDGDALRPVMFWLANGQGVWQQLTAFPQRPEPSSQGAN